MIDFKFDTQLLIEGEDLSEDKVFADISQKFPGDCLLVVGDETLLKVHFHTNAPWQVLEYCASLGDIHDIIVENMERQAKGLAG
jgi:dihydroxyacetone kinase-like predicted kinase